MGEMTAIHAYGNMASLTVRQSFLFGLIAGVILTCGAGFTVSRFRRRRHPGVSDSNR